MYKTNSFCGSWVSQKGSEVTGFAFVLRVSLCVEENVGLGLTHFLHGTHTQFGVVTVHPKPSFCIITKGSVVARAKSLPMMHDDSGELVEEVLRVGYVTGVFAAVGLHVQLLLKLNVNANLLPVVSPRPPEAFEVQPENMRQFVNHQLFLSFSQDHLL